MAAKLARLIQKDNTNDPGGTKLYYWPSSLPVVSSETFVYIHYTSLLSVLGMYLLYIMQ